MNNSFKELPSGYRIKKDFSLKELYIQIIISLFALVSLVVPSLILIIIKKFDFTFPKEDKELIIELLIAGVLFFIGLVLVFLMHEVIHAILYKKYTKEKNTVIINLQEFSIRVENIYIKKNIINKIMITPVLIISLVLLIPILILPLNFINIVFILLFSISIATASDDILTIIMMINCSNDALFLYSNNQIVIYDCY